MYSQTQTVQKPPVNPSRVHDFLYDNHYIVSSERDHARAAFKSHTSTDRVKRVPNYTTMFSELRHHPRFQVRLDATDPVPKFINRQWRGYGEQARDALIRYTTFNYDPAVQVPTRHFEAAHVAGQNRYKYFRRPIIPFLQQVPPEVLLASTRQDMLSLGGGVGVEVMERPPTPLNRTVETQTDYRDSEAQTDPYTPEYVVRPGSQPELLTLATLSYGRGLPAGLAEVEMIERARAKREWEATLPPLSDTSQGEKRRKMMDDMELHEWSLREQEIEKLQEARLQVLKQLLRQREDHQQELNTKRLDKLWSKKQMEKERKVNQIRNEHIKTIRKLTEKRRNVEGKLVRPDVVQNYSDYGSQAYAPLTRIGVFFDRGSEQYVVKSRFISTYQGLTELEASLPEFVTQPRVIAPRPKTVTKSGFVKRKYRHEKELAEVYQVIQEIKNRVEEPPKPLRFLQKIEKPIPRPPTPAVEVPSQEDEERELAIIFLQQVIRGRAIQNMMFEGKEKRIELIRELRSTHALQEAEQLMKKQEKLSTMALQRQRRLHEHKESYIDEGLSQLEGSSLGDMFDFLSKELIRLQEERRIHAFSMLAERQRRIREAEESGRRQIEERRRREEDEVFKQVIKVHQNTVDAYLEDVILNSLDHTADQQARSEVQEVAEKINDVAYELESRRDRLGSEEIVSELVHGFLLPEVRKQHMRQRVKMQQRKYLLAAHKEIHHEGEEVIDQFPKVKASSPVEPPVVADSPMIFGELSMDSSEPQEGKPDSPKPDVKPVAVKKPDSPKSTEQKPSPVGRPPSGNKASSRPASGSSRPTSAKQSTQKDGVELVIEGKSSPGGSKPGSRRGSGSSSKSGKESPKGQTSRSGSRPGSGRKE